MKRTGNHLFMVQFLYIPGGYGVICMTPRRPIGVPGLAVWLMCVYVRKHPLPGLGLNKIKTSAAQYVNSAICTSMGFKFIIIV
jgi:hypothetical protein